MFRKAQLITVQKAQVVKIVAARTALLWYKSCCLLFRRIYRIKSYGKLRLYELRSFSSLWVLIELSNVHRNSVLLQIHVWWGFLLWNELHWGSIPLDIFFIFSCLLFDLRVGDVILLRFFLINTLICILLLKVRFLLHVRIFGGSFFLYFLVLS